MKFYHVWSNNDRVDVSVVDEVSYYLEHGELLLQTVAQHLSHLSTSVSQAGLYVDEVEGLAAVD